MAYYQIRPGFSGVLLPLVPRGRYTCAAAPPQKMPPPDPSPPTSLSSLLAAAERANTQRSYAQALRHFEQEWQGFLPATEGQVAQYLADHAHSLSIATLRQRLAALAHWHGEQGFADPTKGLLVKKVLRGIRATRPIQVQQAQPLALAQLQQADAWLAHQQAAAQTEGDKVQALRHARDRAMLLLGFWRGFRSDEITRLAIEHLQLTPGQALVCYLPQSKGDRLNLGRSFDCPALPRLCPVAATHAWLQLSGLRAGPLFPGIDQWGHVASRPMAAASIAPWLQKLLHAAGIEGAAGFSSHSLRRGFANWARDAGWDLRELMAYVGWKDMKSALRYLDAGGSGLQARFAQALGSEGDADTKHPPKAPRPS